MKQVFSEDKENRIFQISKIFLDIYCTKIYLETNKELSEKEKFDYRMGFIHGMRCGILINDRI